MYYDAVSDYTKRSVLSSQHPTDFKSLVGVEKVTTAKTDAKPAARKKCLSRYEQSLLDVKEGRVNSYENSEEFFKKMGI